MNDENLIPSSLREAREIKELGSKGGKASAKKRKEYKSMKSAFQTLLSMKAKDKDDIEKIKEYGIENTNQMVAAVAMFEMVKKKNSKSVDAFEAVMKALGESTGQTQSSPDNDKSFNNLVEAINNV